MLLLRKEGLPYFRVRKSEYEDDYEESLLLILMKFAEIPTIIFKVLSFEIIFS
jgi:hypothetical protein